MFYNDIKGYMSPSALSQWRHGRGQFIRTYFAQEDHIETAAMRTGTEIHALIEAGIIKAKHDFANGEQELIVDVPGTNFRFLGRPDSFEAQPTRKSAAFVDYKTGKDNGWEDKLPTDLKMRATAWLVWMHTGRPEEVIGHIEFFQTTWDAGLKKLVPIDGKESEVVSIVYTYEELDIFTGVIKQAMEEVNEYYEKWKESTGEFVSTEDVERSVEIRNTLNELEKELEEVEDRILAQMEFGGELNHKTPYGTYFLANKKTFEYPKELRFLLDGKEEFTLEKAERVAAGVKAAKTNYELVNEPKEVKTSISFRAAKK